MYNNAQTLNLQRFIYLVARQLRRARRQVRAISLHSGLHNMPAHGTYPSCATPGRVVASSYQHSAQEGNRTAPNPAILQGGAGGVVATANAAYCLRTILKDLMEQLNSTQLVHFIELPPEVAAAAAAEGSPPSAAQAPDATAAAAAAAAAEPAAEGGASPGGSPAAGRPGQAEFAQLHSGSLVHTLVREAMLTLVDAHLL